MRTEDRYDSLFEEAERVRLVDLMGAELVDDSDRQTEVAEGAVGAPRKLAASIPWEGSLVRRDERPRVKNAKSNLRWDALDAKRYALASARKRRTMAPPTTAAERLAALVATPRTEGPTPRPDMFGPNVRPTEGPAADLVGRPQRFAYLADAPDTYARHNADGSHAQYRRDTDGAWYDTGATWNGSRFVEPDTDATEVTPNTDDRFIVKVGRDAELERAAAFYLMLAGDEATA